MRITHITAGLITLVLVLTISVAASAQASPAQTSPPASSQASPQDTPAQAPQAQQPQDMPSQPGPSQPSAGQSAPSQSAPSQTQSSSSQADNDNPLSLTEDQKTKLRPIIADENQKMEAVRNDSTLSTDQKIEKANQIREEASPKIKAILTPEQLQKLADLQQKAKQQREQNQAQPPSSPQK